MEYHIDKGWSWVVLLGVFGTCVLSFGFIQCTGVFFIDWQEDFEASAQSVGWSSSMSLAGFAFAGTANLYQINSLS